MIPLNYHQLYYFWTIAKCGSFKAAGERLLLAVPTLSLQMTQLERSLKLRLLERGRAGVSMTPEGRRIYERCERIFSEGEALAGLLRTGAHTLPVSLRLGVQDSVSAGVVLQIIDFVEGLGTETGVAVHGGFREELQDRLARHALDVVVMNFDYSASLGADFASRLVAKIPLSFVGTRQFGRRLKRFPADLARLPLLLRTPENPVRRAVDAYFARHGIVPQIEAEIDNPQLIRQLALQGRGAAVLDSLTVSADLRSGKLARLHGRPTGMEEYVWLLYNSRRRPNLNLDRAVAGLARDFSVKY